MLIRVIRGSIRVIPVCRTFYQPTAPHWAVRQEWTKFVIIREIPACRTFYQPTAPHWAVRQA